MNAGRNESRPNGEIAEETMKWKKKESIGFKAPMAAASFTWLPFKFFRLSPSDVPTSP